MSDFTKILGDLAFGLSAAGAIGQTYASFRRSSGEARGYNYQAEVARNNRQLSEWQAEEALARGMSTQRDVQLRGAQFLGRQRAVLGSRNVAMNEGSALNLLADTEYGIKHDSNVAADNAAKEAWALRMQALNYGTNASLLSERADAQSPFMDAAGTALTSAGRVAQSWYTLNSDRGTGSGRLSLLP